MCVSRVGLGTVYRIRCRCGIEVDTEMPVRHPVPHPDLPAWGDVQKHRRGRGSRARDDNAGKRDAREVYALQGVAAHHAIALELRINFETPHVRDGRHGAREAVSRARANGVGRDELPKNYLKSVSNQKMGQRQSDRLESLEK